MVFSGLIPDSKKQKFPVSSSKPPYEVYADSMVNCSHGFPLWKPGPPQLRHGVLLDHVSIAHVGYIHEGRFELLFDAGEDVGSRERGKEVPDDFFFNPRLAEERAHPVPEEPRTASTEFWGFKESTGLEVSTSISGLPGVPGLPAASVSLDLHATREQGAVLKTHATTHVLNAPRPSVFKEYMRKNYRSWVRFGRDNYHHSVDYDNLVIVTGVDLTSRCTMLAYEKSSTDTSASFSLDAAAFGSASLSAWKNRKQPEWTWSSSGSDDYLASLSSPVAGPFITMVESTEPLPRQCVFLRGWRSRSRRAPTRLAGGAGPDDPKFPPDSSEPDTSTSSYEEMSASASETSIDEEVEIVPVASSSPFADPLQPLFDYVFENAEAVLALVHDAQCHSIVMAAREADSNDHEQRQIEDMTLQQAVQLMRPTIEVDSDGVGTLKVPLYDPIKAHSAMSTQRLQQLKPTRADGAGDGTAESSAEASSSARAVQDFPNITDAPVTDHSQRLFDSADHSSQGQSDISPAAPLEPDIRSARSTAQILPNLATVAGSDPTKVVKVIASDAKTGETRELSYDNCKVVGTGSFSVVFQACLLDVPKDQGDIAIKKILQDKRFKSRELQIMRLVQHRNVVDLRAFFYAKGDMKDEEYLHLVLEYVPETVYRASRRYAKLKQPMPMLEIKLYMYQLFRSLCYIHSVGICHRDIQPQNLLLNPSTGVLKLCDFGSAKILVAGEANVSYLCSRYYRAPELIFGATDYTTSIDVWSTGCVMAGLMLGQPLFPGESGVDQLVEIIKVLGTPSREQIKTMNPNYIEHKFPQIKPQPLAQVFRPRTTLEAVELVRRMLTYTPEARPSAVEAMTDPFFDELRVEGTRMPDDKELPVLFDFTREELSVRPDLNRQLVPAWAEPELAARGIRLDGFVPHEQMRITLD